MQVIPKNIRYLRENRGKSKTWVGQQIGRSDSVVGNYETGKVIVPTPILYRYAELFNVKVGDLTDRDLTEESTTGIVSEPPPTYGINRLQREKDLLHRELDLRMEEIDLLHESIRSNPKALAELKALDPDLYVALEKRRKRE